MRSAEMIGWAIGGLEREIMATRERLSTLTAQANALRAKLPGSRGRGATAAPLSADTGVSESPANGRRKRRKRRAMSPEARKRISEMMKKRWAERRRAAK